MSFSRASPWIAMSMILASFACLSTEMIYGVLASTILSHCTLKSYRTLKSPFSTTHSGICLYTTDLPVPVKPSHTFTTSFSRNRHHVFSQSISSMSLTYCPYIFFFQSVCHFSLFILLTLPCILCFIHRHCSSLTYFPKQRLRAISYIPT